jgi:hypothetical protein
MPQLDKRLYVARGEEGVRTFCIPMYGILKPSGELQLSPASM